MKQISREGIKRMITVPQATGGGGGGSFDPTAMGLATEAWVEENYISKAFFNRLFTIHSASSVIDPNDPDEEQTIDSIEALVGLWTEQYLSALGQGSGGGGGGGVTLNEPLSSINTQGLSAPTTAGSALVWYNGAWTYSPSARLQVAGLNSSAAVSVTGSVTATSFVRQGGTSAMFLKADGSVDTTVYAAQDWVNQNFITIAFFETLFNAVDVNGTKINANTTTGIDSIKAMFGFWTNQYLSALGQGSGGGGGGVTLNQPLSSINSAGLGAPSVSGSTLVWNGTTWTYSSSIGDTKNTAGSSAQPSGVQLYLIGASAQATWGVTYSNSGCYIGTDGYLYSGGSKVLTSSAGFVTGVSVNNGNPISPVNGIVALTDIMTTAGGTMTGSLSISGSGSHLSVGGNIGAQGTITSQDYITATGYKVPSGTSAGFLKADGSVDTTTYSTSDTKNTAGAGTLPVAGVLYLVGAPNYNADWQQTYTNSGCYISADGYLYSGGVKVITSTAGLVSGISIGGDTPIEPTNGIVQIPAYPVNTDTLNTAGSTQKPSNVALYLVGASAQATYGQTYSDSGCYISADGYLYSGGVRVLTSGNVVQTITINNGTPISPTNGNVNINCLTSISSSDVTTALGYTPAASSDLSNYLPMTGGTLTGTLTSSLNRNNTETAAIQLRNTYALQSDYFGWSIEATMANMSAGSSNIIIIGKSMSTKNAAYFGFGYVSSGSNSNYATIGLYGNNKLLVVEASGNVGIGTTPTCKLDVNGSLRATSIAKNGGTSSEFLKADGSVDSNTYVSSTALSNYLPLSGGTLTGTSTGSATAILNINNNYSIAGFTRVVSSINANIPTNSEPIFYIGKDNTEKNGGYFGFKYVGSSSISNFVALGLHSVDNILVANGAGNVGIGTTTPSTKLQVDGNVTATAFVKSGGTSAQFLKADGSVDSTSYATTDTVNTAGATAQPNTTIYLVGAGSYNSTYAVTYTNSGCYISASGHLYSNGQIVLTSAVQTISVNSGTPVSPTNGNININCLTSISSSDITTALGYTPANGSNYLPLAGGTVTGDLGANAKFIMESRFTSSSYYPSNNYILLKVSNGSTVWEGARIGTYIKSNAGTINGYPAGLAFYTKPSGDATAAATLKMVIDANGQVGIGTYEPSYKLHVAGNLGVDTSITCHDLSVTTGSGSTGSASIATDLTVGSHVYVEKIGNGMTNMRFNSNGNVGIGVNNTSGYLLQVNGAVAGTSWTNLSDMRQKNYIEDESIELWQVAGAPLFKFTWKNNAFGTDLHIGSSAQYWQTIVPEAVTTDGIGNLGLQYDVVALLAAITTAKKVQEHERRIEELERENKVLWNMIASLKAA